MLVLQWKRSGPLARADVEKMQDTAIFVRCLIGAFCHTAVKLGFPDGPNAPRHEMVGEELRQVVTVQDKELYLIDQVVGPTRDHLVSRATVTFTAKLLHPTPSEID